MGFLDFLKNIFGQDEKKEDMDDIPDTVEDIKLAELRRWIDSSFGNISDDVGSELKDLGRQISEEKKKMKTNADKLMKAETDDPNLSKREIHFMEGNRSAYIQKVNAFLGDIDVPDGVGGYPEFCDRFDKAIGYFGGKTIRNHQIVRHFLRDDAAEVSHNLNNIVELVKSIKKITKKMKSGEKKRLKEKVVETEKVIERKNELGKSIKTEEDGISKLKKKIGEDEKRIKDIEKGQDYVKFAELSKKRENLLHDKDDLKNSVYHMFSVISPALKKYERISKESKIVKKYIDNPIDTLLDKNGNEIVGITGKIVASIESGEIELKDKKREKIIQELDKFRVDYFEMFVERYSEVKMKVEDMDRELGMIRIKDEIEKMKKSVEKENILLREKKSEIEKMEREMGSIDVLGIKKDLGKAISKCVDRTVRVL